MKRLAWVGVPLLVIAGLVTFWEPAKLFALTVTGRASVCPLNNALESQENERAQLQIKDDILFASKRLAVEGGFIHWTTPDGQYWVPEGSPYVVHFNLAEQKRKIYGTGSHFIQQGDIVFDCGANVGVFVRQALNAGASKVIAVEPGPENLTCLRRNFEKEIAAGTVIVVPKGVWNKVDVLEFHIDPENSAADSFVIQSSDKGRTIQVPVTTVDSLVAELGLPKVDFIKMDIEGSEQRALAGAKETLAKYHPRMSISAYHEPDDPVRIPQIVQEAWTGYRMECGPCEYVKQDKSIRPDILWFH